MTQSVRESIYEAISSIRLIDPHTHINPHHPASSTLADILGYHYYTELVHSAGMPREEIEEEGLHPRELVRRLVQGLPHIENTANYQWLLAICRTFFGFEDARIDHSNWEALYDASEARMNSAEWPQMVLDQSNVEAVFLTNDFDDDLEGFDTDTYIPCLRTDDLVFHLAEPQTRQRLEACTGIELDGSLQSLRSSLEQRFRHFASAGARACAISIPPSFQPLPISDGRAMTALDEVLQRGTGADQSHQVALSRRVFWTLVELCDHYGLPFDLMIGVNRGVYQSGVYQGQDLYDSRVSLIQYRELFNAFGNVKFPISVLASVTNQELVSHSWIFPNLISNGHWWYSNTPSFIARDAAARLEAVPRNKQIGYYSDAYKLEFVWPKFDMYRQILAGILADHFVGFCGWSEEQAIELGRQVLRDNVDETFPPPQDPEATTPIGDTYLEDTVEFDAEDSGVTADVHQLPEASAAATAALAAGAIGIVEVQGSEEIDEVEEVAAVESDEEQADFGEFDEAEDEDATLDYVPEEIADESNQFVEKGEDDAFVVEGVDEYDEFDEEGLPDLPTVLDTKDTVRIEGLEQFGEHAESELQDVDELAETVDLDQLPTEDEVRAVDVPDVQLSQPDAETAPDAEQIEADADSSPLYVGDILDDDEAEVVDLEEASDRQAKDEEIRMFRGEVSFTPDEDSMQLTRDPVTGELMFPLEQPAEADQVTEEAVDATAETVYLEADQSAAIHDVEEAAADEVAENDAQVLEDDVVISEEEQRASELEETLDFDEEKLD